MSAQLPLGMLQEELKAVAWRQTFGDAFPLATAGLGDLPADTMIPGAPIACPRAPSQV